MIKGIEGCKKIKKNEGRVYVRSLPGDCHFGCGTERFHWSEISVGRLKRTSKS